MNRWDVVIVTYNSEEMLRELWLGRDFPDWINLYVIDNSSSDDSLDVAKKFATQAKVSVNHGLSKSNNIGANSGSAPYILFCNPDVWIDPSDLIALEERIANDASILAPRLVGDDGNKQPNARTFPSPFRQLARKLQPKGKIAQRYLWPDTASGSVDWVTGACVAMPRRVFDRIGGWPNELFLYFEDVELCARARDKGIPVVLDESIQVRHVWKQESQVLFSRASREHAKSAYKYYQTRPRELFRI